MFGSASSLRVQNMTDDRRVFTTRVPGSQTKQGEQERSAAHRHFQLAAEPHRAADGLQAPSEIIARPLRTPA